MAAQAPAIGPEAQKAQDFICAALRGEQPDWPPASENDFYELLLVIAGLQGVDSLLCHLLKSTDAWKQFPDSFRNGLLERLRFSGAQEMVRRRDLQLLGTALEQAGIDGLLLKGGGLAYTHYPEPHLRLRVDTDLFIASSDIKKVRLLFEKLSYLLHGNTYRSHQFQAVHQGPGDVSTVYDVHWRSSNRAEYSRILRHEELTAAAVPVPGLAGWRTLQPTHALLLACMHRVANPDHYPNRLIWLYDIHLLVSSMSESELQEFAQRAVAENLQEICREALEKTNECFSTVLPRELMEKLNTPSAVSDSFKQRLSDSQLGLIIDDLKELPDMKSRGALVREYLAPSGEYLLHRYGKKNAAWIPLLYLRYLGSGIADRVLLR